MGTENFNRLSPKQAETLAYIEESLSRYGRPPTYRDIARHFGYEAVGTVQDHVRALVKKGFLKKEEGVSRSFSPTHRAESRDVPILGSVPAGKPIEAVESRMGSISIPAGRWRGELYALKVVGESMRDAGILDGDLAIVAKGAEARDGDIVVAMIDGEATVKTLEKRAGRVRLLPANPRFSPIELRELGENLIAGKVVSIQRFY